MFYCMFYFTCDRSLTGDDVDLYILDAMDEHLLAGR